MMDLQKLRFLALQLIIYFLTLPGVSKSEWGARYTKSPESITVPIGDEVVFTCQTSIVADRVAWMHRSPYSRSIWSEVSAVPANLALPPIAASVQHYNNPVYRVSSKQLLSKLTVDLRNETFAGDYRCVSWYGGAAIASIAAHLAVARLNKVPKLPSRKIIIAPGSTFVLRCPPPVSDPPATIIYYQFVNNVPIPIGDSRASGNVEEIGGMLVIKAEKKMTSMFTCAASNELSGQLVEFNNTILVEVQDGASEPPKFTEDMIEDMKVNEGSSIVLGCSVVGRPAPRLFWRKEGSSLPPGANYKGALLHLPKVQIEDQGIYVCEAINTGGRAEKIIRLTVWYAPKLSHNSKNDEADGESSISEGGIMKLSCGRISGFPRPIVSWFVNGEDVITDANIKVYDNEIEINPVEKRHAGIIQCFATNPLGSATTSNLLHVIPRQQVVQGTNYGIEMSLSKPGNQSPNGRRHSKPRGRNRKKNVMIPPTRPNVTRLSDESVMVRWNVQHNTGLPIQFFKVQYRDLNEGSGVRGGGWMTTNQDIPPHVRSYEVTGLEPDHVYKFKIAAVYSNNDNAAGPNSGKFLLQRGSGLINKAPPAPLLLSAEPVSTTELRLHWQLPVPLNSTGEKEIPIEGFYVYYRLTSSAGEYSKAAVEGGNARSLLLEHLMPGAAYDLKLQSFTPATASNFSVIITQKTMKLPDADNDVETEKIPTKNTNGPTVGLSGSNQMYEIAGGVAGLAALIALIIGILVCKKKRDGPPDKPEGGCIGGGAGGGGVDISNGYLPPSAPSAKPAITITANPMHAESENVDMEMSYISAQNNNCSTRSPRVSTEINGSIASCREEYRKHSPLPALALRENYV